jgi:DNA polymerase alpha subunit A
MELVRARSYDLPSLSVQILGMKEDQIVMYNGNEMRELFESTEKIKHFIQWGMSLSLLNLRLVNELQVMPLALQITTIAGMNLCVN